MPSRFKAFIPILFLFLACEQEGKRPQVPQLPSLPYDLVNPESYELADELKEISGICPTADGQSLLAVADEDGVIYRTDLTGRILEEKKFRKGGDYEDLAVIGKSVYVLTSNGNLHYIADWGAPTLDSDALKSDFKDGLEFESLALDPVKNRLLMLVKDGEGREGKGPVYAFDLANRKFISDPVMLTDPKTIPDMNVKGKSLRGSAMARHPLTGHWYVVTAINHMLVVFNEAGEGIFSSQLPKKTFPQPEGICFTPQGDLFISTEGLSRNARLFYFKYRPQP